MPTISRSSLSLLVDMSLQHFGYCLLRHSPLQVLPPPREEVTHLSPGIVHGESLPLQEGQVVGCCLA